MKPREKFINALERRSPLPGRVPHFELVFYLTMEAFGKVHPQHRNYSQWFQMSEKERQLQREDMAEIYIQTAEKYEHSAIMLHPPEPTTTVEEVLRMLEIIREKSGNKYFLMIHGDATFGIPEGKNIDHFIYRLADEPEAVKHEAEIMVQIALKNAEIYKRHGYLDGFALCSDYCFNKGPFLSPSMFSEFVAPYLEKLVMGYRDMGLYAIKHTDGNIMPILDQLVQTNPHALHSLDPQGGVDIAQVKKIAGDKICLIGNVNCGLLQTGSEEEVVKSALYALQSGMPGGGYIFSTSNCIYTGAPLGRYELMMEVWRKYGDYS
ncbi:MAG: hypothetical protein A2Y21_11865 [Clostridiales bacterium GWC2_40_7]|nr:MAG: hypothetical protein A2Y21_11865 [Clostridiales bacterium GWC2_40_7]